MENLLVLMPQEWLKKDAADQLSLHYLTQLEQEIKGCFLYRPQQVVAPDVGLPGQLATVAVPEQFVIYGIGSGGSVGANDHDRGIEQTVNHFLRQHRDYSIIGLHTHPQHLGSYWHEHPSGTDRRSAQQIAQTMPTYRELILSPTTIFPVLPDCTVIRTAPLEVLRQVSPGYDARRAQVRRTLEDIGRSYGKDMCEVLH